MSDAPVLGAGGIVFDAAGRLLLIRRGRPPGAGLWSVPGGKCEPGESPATACVRELAEETGLAVEVIRQVGVVRLPNVPGRPDFEVHDFECRVREGAGMDASANDDADAVCWADRDLLRVLPTTPGLVEALTSWQLLPRS